MKISLLCLMVISLFGCAQYDAGVAVGKDKASDVADRFLRSGAYITCEAASIGAVRRQYGQSQETADLYNRFCKSGTGNVIKGE